MAVAVVVIVAAAASVQLGIIGRIGGPSGTTTSCSTCFQHEPVVDVVMPALGSSGNTTNPNRQVNMTRGETKSFEVDVYPTIPLGFALSFDTVLSPGSQGATPAITASFQPQSMSVAANAKGAASMTVVAAQTAAKGVYDIVVSATNLANSSQVWGLYFEISVS